MSIEEWTLLGTGVNVFLLLLLLLLVLMYKRGD